MCCHHLNIKFHVKIQISSLHSYLTTITWRCCLPLLTFPRCTPACSVSRATYTAAWSTADLKELQTMTLEWPPESSVCKPLANASSFSCHCASDSSCSLLPVLSPSFWPHALRSISLLKGCIQNQNNAPGGADPGREFKVFILYTISFHPCQLAQQVQRQPIWRKPHNIQSWFCLVTLAK